MSEIKIKKTYEFPVSTWLTFDTKKKVYEIAQQANTTVSDIVRNFIEKGVSEYVRK